MYFEQNYKIKNKVMNILCISSFSLSKTIKRLSSFCKLPIITDENGKYAHN